MSETMLTTIDNPYNPHDHFDEWLNWDMRAGYNTCAYLARECPISDELEDWEKDALLEEAKREIIELNPTGMHCLIREGEKTPLSTKLK